MPVSDANAIILPQAIERRSLDQARQSNQRRRAVAKNHLLYMLSPLRCPNHEAYGELPAQAGLSVAADMPCAYQLRHPSVLTMEAAEPWD